MHDHELFWNFDTLKDYYSYSLHIQESKWLFDYSLYIQGSKWLLILNSFLQDTLFSQPKFFLFFIFIFYVYEFVRG